ncbi:hypothetical protein [Pseudonocardia spinosispora]|uniref:hypothetical protein n=1 Tax=Pseudonocardia spinosispora TaxID=103441 RepID=UPI00040B5396|nr:hypothetical protein [Pseudonocardia spinosispora]
MTSTGLTTHRHEHNHDVRVEDLRCPGCGEPAIPEPPEDRPRAGGEFSHSDGTALCARADGTAAEPIEVAW